MQRTCFILFLCTILFTGCTNFIIEQSNDNSASDVANKNTKQKTKIYGIRIPEEVYNTAPEDEYIKYFTYNKKVIYFSYADCPIGRAMKENTIKYLTNNNLSENYALSYKLHPQGAVTSVLLVHTAKNFLYKKCSTGYVCIINPEAKRMIQLNPRQPEYEQELIKYKDW